MEEDTLYDTLAPDVARSSLLPRDKAKRPPISARVHKLVSKPSPNAPIPTAANPDRAPLLSSIADFHPRPRKSPPNTKPPPERHSPAPSRPDSPLCGPHPHPQSPSALHAHAHCSGERPLLRRFQDHRHHHSRHSLASLFPLRPYLPLSCSATLLADPLAAVLRIAIHWLLCA